MEPARDNAADRLIAEKASRAMPGALRRSGGLRWHGRALRRWRLHEPFRRSIHAFLQAWQPDGSDLILLGPSAGWFLPSIFLRRFSRLILVELDTSAPLFFSLRHGRALQQSGTTLEWLQADLVTVLPRLLAAHRSAAVLFCNVLGQLGLERGDYESRLAEFSGLLEGRSWASFHDRFSAHLPIDRLANATAFSTATPMDAAMLQRLGCSGEWTDHGTGAVLPPGILRHYFPWRIVPDRFHWVEAGIVQ